jgi:hypothetical protein
MIGSREIISVSPRQAKSEYRSTKLETILKSQKLNDRNKGNNKAKKFLTIIRLLKNSFDVLGRHSCGSRNPGFPVKTGTQIFFIGSPLPRGQRLDSRSLLKTCRDKLRGSDGKTKFFRILLENSNFAFVSVPRFAGSIFGFRIYPHSLFFNPRLSPWLHFSICGAGPGPPGPPPSGR